MIIIYIKYLFSDKNFKLISQIIFVVSFLFIINNEKIYIKSNEDLKAIKIRKLIIKLNVFAKHRKPQYILFSDFFGSKYCSDINAYTLFEYYLNNNIDEVYYIINGESELYYTLEKENKIGNLIIYNKSEIIFDKLFNYLLNSKIIIQSYVLLDFQYIINNVTYLKYLYINHGITYFKNNFVAPELIYLNEDKRNIITSSPYEYNIFVNKFNYSNKYIYKAGIARYDTYKTIQLDKSEKDCILISFTYRSYNSLYYEKSLYKKNIIKLLNQNSLIDFLKKKNIDLIYIPHHNELFLQKNYNQTNFQYAKIKGQKDLTKYIKKCSLLITDFSSISFAFMFQLKPILFYLIDFNDTINVAEKKYMDPNNELYFGKAFISQNTLIKQIKYYVNIRFRIDSNLKKKYKNVFYFRNNICKRISKIINFVIQK